LFADDGKCYLALEAGSSEVFQAAVNASHAHLQSLQLDFSLMKCCVLHFDRSNPQTPLFVGGSVIRAVDYERDLGVWFTKDLKFSVHYATIVKRAMGLMHAILRSFEIRDRQFLVQLFRTYVLPIVMYASEVWSPDLLKDIDSMESVLRWWTKRVPGLRNVPYVQRLKVLGLEPLELMRLKADLVFAYKIINGLVIISNSDSFLPRVIDLVCDKLASTRGKGQKLVKMPYRLERRRNFFTCRIFSVEFSQARCCKCTIVRYFFRKAKAGWKCHFYKQSLLE